MARALGRDHDHVVPFRRRDPIVVDVEAVREQQGGAGLQVRRDLLLVQSRLRAVGHEERDELSTAYRVGDGTDGQPGLFRRGRRRAPGTQADLDLDA